MAGATPPSNLNIANALTVVRIVGVPFFGWLLLTHDGESIGFRLAAWVAFALLMITDRIDGDLARKYDLVTNFGKLADPIADKALTGMAFVGLSIIFDSWLFWAVTIVVLVREWGITAMRFVVKRYGVMPAGQGGKVKTMLQALALGGYILPLELWDNVPSDILLWITHLLMAGAVILTLTTGVQYVKDAIALRRSAKAGASS
ncbi:CDP-diacylglycerol--glycerol-3-phosphate 3-phosphatidyltransferase [Aeromicrobium wangtongii]|uniref:CDP-diacylglycerol--glycerol-3-phosphate 3-phosphatidyltransferase n=1 Tax=Aeromicrobium wangtongii TaxID=2969247 RepID=A0ABY5M2L9_9ACTN|nr:CDP-diacylglycerol--glycerol-3-phosphate 3-phosphatidyltransferase [Aeromicrobium wangtongii]MCD9198410.1 CDP-diacylglycerol--glycerol-3-phosphate 3-phosphatidyltransferase [Aeromicrobium wangtongii]UUP12440.1 CDP-diacylglycerol--glycerol-3-phosphate 3-phosphatidyltransferase [Aeromicrobium wangtongii]